MHGADDAAARRGVLVVDADLRRASQHRAGAWPAAGGGPVRRRARRRRQQPGRHRRGRRRGSPRPTPRCTCCTGRARRGSGAAYVAGFRWGLDARLRRARRDGRRRLAPARAAARRCWPPWRTPTWCSGSRWVAGRAVCRTGRPRAGCCRAAATPTCGWRSGWGCATRPAVSARSAASTLETIDLARRRQPRLLLPGRPGLAGGAAAAPRSSRCRSTFVEREHGALEDERGHRARGAVAGDTCGASQPRLAAGRGPCWAPTGEGDDAWAPCSSCCSCWCRSWRST